ncbi:MAG: excinuclease ABC subunit UvrC [Elusimicrobia bacterium]|nr:excinuclease ABC subunit UvrC [Elusimicrobiota bacterium]
MTNEDLTPLPAEPGVYLMRDASGKIIYIGKAKNLRKRVTSYFQKTDVGPKIQALLQVVRRIDFVTLASEREALICEEAWIKKYQPVFNAMWKDDKSYPYAVLTTQEDFPRIYLARKKHIPAGSLTFGPYPDAGRVRGLIRFLFRSGILPLRPCKWEFSIKETLEPKIIASCLYYHTNQCPAPCAGKITKEAYRQIAVKAAMIFSGNRPSLAKALKQQMKAAVKKLDFETAGRLKIELEAIAHIGEKVILNEIQAQNLAEIYEPRPALRRLREIFGLNRIPDHIEGFDISNLYGNQSVGSMVCFIDGKPNKAHYRHFRIKTVLGIDDTAMIREVVSRRLSRLLGEKEALPDLFLIDGGAGQLAAARRGFDGAMERMSDGATKKSTPILISLAKKEETLYLDQNPEAPQEIRLAKTDEGLKLCMWIRDEAHRFAITFHKKLRRKKFLEEPL